MLTKHTDRGKQITITITIAVKSVARSSVDVRVYTVGLINTNPPIWDYTKVTCIKDVGGTKAITIADTGRGKKHEHIRG